MLKFMVFSGGNLINTYLLDEPVVTIGRLPENTIQLIGDGVSRRHLRIEEEYDGSFVLTDLHSLNGTMVSGRLVRKTPLQSGDTIVIGDVTVVFEQTEAAAGETTGSQQPGGQDEPAPTPATGPQMDPEFQTQKMPSLVEEQVEPHYAVLTSKASNLRVELYKDFFTFGTDRSDDIKVKGFMIGRRQAFLKWSDEGWRVGTDKKFGSLKVNDRPVKSHLLRDHDRIRIGEAAFDYLEGG